MTPSDFPPHPEGRLASLLESLFTGQPLAPDVREWMLKAFTHYLRHGGAAPLDRFLGIGPINAGERSLSTRLSMLKRDLQLLEALEKISLDDSVTDWGRCVRLEKEIPNFEANAWKLHRHRRYPPEHWSEWQHALFAAYQAGLRMPRTARGLYEIMKQARALSLRSPGVKLLTSLTRIQTHEKDLVHPQSFSQ